MTKLHQRTSQWFETLVRTDSLYTGWLPSLYWAERGGALRFGEIVGRFQPRGYAFNSYAGIIADEFRHAGLVEHLLVEKGIPVPSAPKPERYWGQIWPWIKSFEDACAAGAFGEMLARNRFRVIARHPLLPADFRPIVEQILPDEERHAELLGKLAGTDAMHRMRPHHMHGMAALGLVEVVEDD
ncbi:MAG: ferritin-like domain-containing protein [Patescibacteria group bacterium]|nr:MAG: ferritin-like domain-containing protein [Patescibacteria group bacterium]